MDLTSFRPYLAIVISHISPGRRAAFTTAVLNDLELELSISQARSAKRKLLHEVREAQSGSMSWSAAVYARDGAPPWLAAEDEELKVIDRDHHLLLIGRLERYLICHGSEPAVMDAFGRLVERKGEDRNSFLSLEPVPGPTMNAAFVTGPARTLWLSGIHPSTRNKADSKILSGPALEDALDPLADQTYSFSAVRSTSRTLRRSGDSTDALVGVSPRRSRIWLGPTKSWSDFLERTQMALKVLKATEAAGRQTASPLPVLATPLQDLAGVADPFDVALYPPPPSSESAEQTTEAETAERWEAASFEVLSANGLEASVRLSLDGAALGEAKLTVTMPIRGAAECRLLQTVALGDAQLLAEGLTLATEREWLRVRFDSGHAFANGQLHALRFRDAPFNAWKFEDMAGFDVCREKPGQGPRSTFVPADVGRKDSLFCWVVRTWAAGRDGWLLCDDGADEIADFLHVDPSTELPTLTLIHAKGANSSSAAREISVSAYEIVTAQAMKNIRHLDPKVTADVLEKGSSRPVAGLVWKAGQKLPDRSGPIAFLRQMGARYEKRVVVLQPHVTRAAFDKARELMRQEQIDPRVNRLRQLDALLMSAQTECRGQSAELLVIGAE